MSSARAHAAELKRRALAPIDASGLIVYRVVYGSLLALTAFGYLFSGEFQDNVIDAQFLIGYQWFQWLPVPSGPILSGAVAALGLCGALMAAGWYQRMACGVGSLLGAYLVFLDRSIFVNHFYLMLLLLGLSATLRLDGVARLGRRSSADVQVCWASAPTLPAWYLWTLRGQLAIVYIFGGLVKINYDWLWRAEPLTSWLRHRKDHPLVGAIATTEWAPYFFSHAGLLIDLLVVPALLWRKTRALAVVGSICFHLANAALWPIGVFPWLMIALTSLYFEPDWPRRLADRVRGHRQVREVLESRPDVGGNHSRLLACGLCAHFILQILLPLRHYAYPGNPDWTEEGSHFAWRMMVRHKTGSVSYRIVDPHDRSVRVVAARPLLTQKQRRRLPRHPDMIVAFAQLLAKVEAQAGRPGVEIYADAWARLNGRARQRLIDPSVDLARVERSIWPARFIVPLAPD